VSPHHDGLSRSRHRGSRNFPCCGAAVLPYLTTLAIDPHKELHTPSCSAPNYFTSGLIGLTLEETMDPKNIPYSYSSLPPGHDSTRLLRLMPNKDETAVIKCQLFDYTLESGKQTHLYEALSYVWGDPNKTVPIFVGEHCFNITENLHTALLHLRNHSIERIIWVDAVCIDQANEQEKVHQIQYMAKIYGQATHVIIWLGEAADNSDQAFEDIRVAAEDEFTNSLIEETGQKAILKLLERLWFRRIWVREQILNNIYKVLKIDLGTSGSRCSAKRSDHV
jgi:hypothetical protein